MCVPPHGANVEGLRVHAVHVWGACGAEGGVRASKQSVWGRGCQVSPRNLLEAMGSCRALSDVAQPSRLLTLCVSVGGTATELYTTVGVVAVHGSP